MTADKEIVGCNLEESLPFIRLVQDKLQHWEETGRRPYAEEKPHPHQDAWWIHVRQLLTHEIRLSEPKPFECADPRRSLEPLYLSVTAPCRPVMEQQKRLKRAVKKCLRDVYYRFHPLNYPGRGGLGIEFWRGYRRSDRTVAINCVNLATLRARRLWDILLGQFSRLDETQADKLTVLIGYLPPPEESPVPTQVLQLLGERHRSLRAIDLLRQPDALRQAAEELVEDR
jgi:hypothetical protein